MSSRHQPENGADSQDYEQTAETATASSDRLHSAGDAPDGVAPQTVSRGVNPRRSYTTSAGGTSADNEPATNAGRAILAASICKCGTAKSYHPRPGHDYEPRYNVDAAMIVRVEREAAECAATASALQAESEGLDVRRIAVHFPFARNGTLYCDCGWHLDVATALDWWGHVEAEYDRLATPQPGEGR